MATQSLKHPQRYISQHIDGSTLFETCELKTISLTHGGTVMSDAVSSTRIKTDNNATHGAKCGRVNLTPSRVLSISAAYIAPC